MVIRATIRVRMLVFFSRGDCIFISGIYGILCVFLEENCSCDCHIYVLFIEIKHIPSTSSTRVTIPVYGDDLHLFFRSERNCNVRKNTCFYLSSTLKKELSQFEKSEFWTHKFYADSKSRFISKVFNGTENRVPSY